MAASKSLFLAILALLLVGSLGGIQAADRFWVASGPGDFSNSASWSATSGGTGGATVPGASDRARFNSLRLGDCTLSTPISVGGILIEAGYSGTISQIAGQTLAVGSQGFSQAAGTWLGNDASFTVSGAFTLSGGSITCTSGVLAINGNFAHTLGGSFVPNYGTVSLTGAAATIDVAATETFFNLILAKNAGSALNVAASDSLIVQNQLTLTDGLVNQSTVPATGTIQANGNILQEVGFDGGTGTLAVSGSVPQSFVGNSSQTAGLLPNVVLKSTSTLTLQGTLRTAKNWTYTSGLVDPGTSTVVFAGTISIVGSHALFNVVFNSNSSAATTVTLGATTNLTIKGSLLFANSSATKGAMTLNTGTLSAQGPITVADNGNYSGSATLLIDGAADQVFSCNSTRTVGGLPKVNINKPSGALSLSGLFRVVQSWTWTAGAVAPGACTQVIAAGVTIPG
jgi:hypothetical protein